MRNHHEQQRGITQWMFSLNLIRPQPQSLSIVEASIFDTIFGVSSNLTWISSRDNRSHKVSWQTVPSIRLHTPNPRHQRPVNYKTIKAHRRLHRPFCGGNESPARLFMNNMWDLSMALTGSLPKISLMNASIAFFTVMQSRWEISNLTVLEWQPESRKCHR